jgi:hypothetical protein
MVMASEAVENARNNRKLQRIEQRLKLAANLSNRCGLTLTKQSAARLSDLTLNCPAQTRQLFKRIREMPVKPEKLSVPKRLFAAQNLKKIDDFARLMILPRGETLDLDRLGLRNKGGIDLVRGFVPQSLEDYFSVVSSSQKLFTDNEGLGVLFLFKSSQELLVSLYEAGEVRSAAKILGQRPKLTPELQRIQGFIEGVTQLYPFKTAEQFLVHKELLLTHYLIGLLNNTAANTKLASLLDHLETLMDNQTRQRLALARHSGNLKVRHLGRGIWRIKTSGYYRTEIGLRQKQPRDQDVTTGLLLSLIGNVIESQVDDRQQLSLTQKRLRRLQLDPAGASREIREIRAQLGGYQAQRIEKAAVELGGALRLIKVGTKQAISLAAGVIYRARRDIVWREREIAAQRKRYVRLSSEAEEEIGRNINRISKESISALNDTRLLHDQSLLAAVADRLGSYLGTFFYGELREPWLGSAESRVAGALRIVRAIQAILAIKRALFVQTTALRDEYVAQRNKIWKRQLSAKQKKEALKTLKTNTLAGVRQNLVLINGLNVKIVGELRKAAGLVGKMKDDFKDRAVEGQIAAAPAENKILLSKLDKWEQDLVEATDIENEGLGEVLRKDAQEMDLIISA